MNKKTFVYLRVSTLQQKTDSQKASIREWLQRHGIADATWVEDKCTGKDTARGEYQKLLGQVEGGWVARVIAYDASRVGRSLLNNLAFAKACIDRSVALIGVKDGIDLTTKDGRFMFGMLSLMAERQREDIVERTREGVAARMAKCRYCGKLKEEHRPGADHAWAATPHGGTALGWTSNAVKAKLGIVYKLLDIGTSMRKIKECTGLNYRTIRKYRDARDKPVRSRKELNTEVYGRSEAKPQ